MFPQLLIIFCSSWYLLSLDLEDLGYLHISKSKVLKCIRKKLASEIICMLCFCLNVCNMLPGPHKRRELKRGSLHSHFLLEQKY